MGLHDKWSLAVRLAAAFAYLLLHAGHSVGLLVFSETLDLHYPAARGREHFQRLLGVLRRCQPRVEGGASIPESCLKALPRQTAVLLLSDLLRPDGMLSMLDRLLLTGRPLHVLRIYSCRDCRPAATGRVLLRDVETGARIAVTLQESTLLAAQSALDGWSGKIRDYCRNRGLPYTPCPVSSGWETCLVQHLRRLEADHA